PRALGARSTDLRLPRPRRVRRRSGLSREARRRARVLPRTYHADRARGVPRRRGGRGGETQRPGWAASPRVARRNPPAVVGVPPPSGSPAPHAPAEGGARRAPPPPVPPRGPPFRSQNVSPVPTMT